MGFQVYHFLVLFVVATFGIHSYLHHKIHGSLSFEFLSLVFFLPLNSLICFWEIGLGLHISHIKKEYESLQTRFKGKRMGAVVEFFLMPLDANKIVSLKFWSRVWSTYSLYDPSYSNQESFGFFVDVGNGWTTIIPSLLFLIGMTVEIVPPQILGMLGLAKFYQELYGTCIYFLSYVFNKRYVGRPAVEVGLFVGISNGLWFAFPLIGMWASIQLILTASYQVFR